MTEPEAIRRCREAIHDTDDMLSVASRSDFSELLLAYDDAVAKLAECEAVIAGLNR